MEKDKENIFWELFANDISADVSKNRSQELEKMLNNDSELKHIYDIINTIHINVDCTDAENDKNKTLRMTYNKIFEVKEKPGKGFLFTSLKIVATIALIITVSWLSFEYGTKHEKSEDWIEYYCQNGGFSKLILSDSTEVFVNAGTKFRYPAHFKGDMRNVELVGEAYFNVTPNEKKPFIVSNKTFSIKVLGTSFNVKAYEADSIYKTTLVSGSVEITTGKENSKYTLKPNEQISIIASTGQLLFKKDVDTSYYTSWKDGDLSFNQTSFSEICKLLERKYGVNITIKNPQLANAKFTGRFINGEGLYQVLDIIKKNTQFSYKLGDKNTLIIN